MNEMIKGVDAKRMVSNHAVSEVIDTNKMIVEALGMGYKGYQNADTNVSIDIGHNSFSKSVYPGDDRNGYIEQLESENRELKRRLNEEIERNGLLVNKLKEEGIPVPKMGVSRSRNEGSEVEIENRSLKQQVRKQSDDLSRVYYELEVLKNNNDRIRKDTVQLLGKRGSRASRY